MNSANQSKNVCDDDAIQLTDEQACASDIDLTTTKISFVGGGNMAQAMISGLLNQGVAATQITVADPDAQKRQMLADKGIHTIDASQDPTAAIINADVVILAVKPQVMAQVLAQFSSALSSQLVVSIAAGVSLASLSDMLGGYSTLVRAMPNTPAMLQAGASGLYADNHISQTHRKLAHALLAASGLAIWVETEAHLHAVTAVSGSAPAYFFYFIESIVKTGVALGLSEAQAAQLAMQTAFGAAKMCLTGDDGPAELRQKVTSPNGTTQAAIASMQASNIDEYIAAAMQACYQRSVELAGEA